MAKYGLSYFIISWAKKKSVTFHLEAVTANPKLGLKELSIQVIHALHRLQKNKRSTRNESGQEYKNVQINALVRSENKKSTLLSLAN